MLNSTQKNILDGTLKFMLDSICDVGKKTIALKGLELILADSISEEQRKLYNSIGIWESINQVRQILKHPFPQNRTTSYPYFGAPSDPNLIVYKDENGKPAYEQKGLLSLTSRNDTTTPPVTKADVVSYVTKLVHNQIENLDNIFFAFDMERDMRRAIKQGDKEKLLPLIDILEVNEIPIDFDFPIYRDVPMLKYAIEENNPEMVELLLASGANPNHSSNPLVTAVITNPSHIDKEDYVENKRKIVKLLCNAGANPNLPHISGKSSLYFATDVIILNTLLQNEANLDSLLDFCCPLQQMDDAIPSLHFTIDKIELLETYGFDIFNINKSGYTLLDSLMFSFGKRNPHLSVLLWDNKENTFNLIQYLMERHDMEQLSKYCMDGNVNIEFWGEPEFTAYRWDVDTAELVSFIEDYLQSRQSSSYGFFSKPT